MITVHAIFITFHIVFILFYFMCNFVLGWSTNLVYSFNLVYIYQNNAKFTKKVSFIHKVEKSDNLKNAIRDKKKAHHEQKTT